MMQAEQYLNIGYQRILTFERPGGGFDWWGRDPALVWLSAYGVQQLTALSKVKEIDTGVIHRAHGFLMSQQNGDGSWNVVGQTHGETIASMTDPSVALTGYVSWALAEADFQYTARRGCEYLRANWQKVKDNPYVLALMANAFLTVRPDDGTGRMLLEELIRLKVEKDDRVQWQANGATATRAYGSSADIETTALATLALMKDAKYTDVVNKALQFLVKSKSSSGTWGSTQATILALKCLVASQMAQTKGGAAGVKIYLNGEAAGVWSIDDSNRDVLQLADLRSKTRVGDNRLKLEVSGRPNVMYQVVARHYRPWRQRPVPPRPQVDLKVDYDRTVLAKDDTVVARASFKYNGERPTFMVIIDLGIPPGFTIDVGDFAELVGAEKIQRYSVTPTQITLYLGDVPVGHELTFPYHLKARYPLKAQTPPSTVYEYYSPNIRSIARPTEIEVMANK